MNKIVKYGAILFAITAATGLILGGVHTMTLEPIKIAQQNEKNEALAATLPGATDFKQLEVAQDAGIVKEAYEGSANGETLGYNVTVMPKGYGGLITMVVGVDKEYKVRNIKILAHSETPGLGARAGEEKFAGQFKDRNAANELSVTKTPPENDTQIQAISGATITSRAVTSGVNTAVNYVKGICGDTVTDSVSEASKNTQDNSENKTEEAKTND